MDATVLFFVMIDTHRLFEIDPNHVLLSVYPRDLEALKELQRRRLLLPEPYAKMNTLNKQIKRIKREFDEAEDARTRNAVAQEKLQKEFEILADLSASSAKNTNTSFLK
jgi:hypothetical protein